MIARPDPESCSAYASLNPLRFADPYGYSSIGDFLTGSGSYFLGIYDAYRFILRYNGLLGRCEQLKAGLEDEFLEAALNQLRNDADIRAQALQQLKSYVLDNKARVTGRFLTSQAIGLGLGLAQGGNIGRGIGAALTVTAVIGTVRSEIENGGRSIEDLIRAGVGGDVRVRIDPVCGC